MLSGIISYYFFFEQKHQDNVGVPELNQKAETGLHHSGIVSKYLTGFNERMHVEQSRYETVSQGCKLWPFYGT